MNIDEFATAVTPEVYERFRDAIAIGKWANGESLSAEQRTICMQAIIAYEHKNVPEEQRTGYVPPKETACGHDDHDHSDEETPLKWQS